MLALQGTLTVPSFYGVSSLMDEHAMESAHASPSGSGSMGWRMRTPTSRYQPQLPPEGADLGSTGLSGESSILWHRAALIWFITIQNIPKLGLILVDRRLLTPLTNKTNILLAQFSRALARDSRNHTHTNTDKV